MRATVRQRWPVWAVLIGLYLAVMTLMVVIIRQTEGIFLYALDDAYIHLAMAKHFANAGVWGATSYAFSASTSSPGWTLLLSIFIKVWGRPEIWPLILSVLAATGLVVLVDRLITPMIPRAPWRFLVLLFLVLLAPLPVLIFTGMEHVLQLLLIAVLLALLQRYEASYPRVQRARWALWCVAALLTMVRYESIFLLLPLAGYYLLWRRDWRLAGGLVAASALGPLVMGVIQVAHGWDFLPNSILAKGTNVTAGSVWSALVGRVLYNLPRSATLLVLALIVLGLAPIRFRHRRWQEPLAGWTASFLIATACQYTLAQVGWLYRYEAYLILFGGLLFCAGDFVTAVRAWFRTLGTRGRLLAVASCALAACVAVPVMGFRMYRSLQDIPSAVEVNYRQNYQIARFIARYYPDTVVAINDLGLVSYLTDAPLIDLYGLASREPLIAQLAGKFNVDFIHTWSQAAGARLAIVHDLFFRREQLPATWTRVGGWAVYSPFIEAEVVVSIYAIPPTEVPRLTRDWEAFALGLPAATRASQTTSTP